MTVENIIKAVRWCIDEEALNNASFASASAGDIGYMDNIIRNKIGDALRWVCLYAPAEMLSGSSSSSADLDIIQEDDLTASDNVLTPQKTLIRVIRVKSDEWSRAISGDSLIKEDSNEYLQLSDEFGARATADRPQAALRNTKEKKVEVYPDDGNFVLTYIRATSLSDTSSLTPASIVNIPAQVETSFIYYLAFLLLSAYGDVRAKGMYEVATMSLGKTDDKQRN